MLKTDLYSAIKSEDSEAHKSIVVRPVIVENFKETDTQCQLSYQTTSHVERLFKKGDS